MTCEGLTMAVGLVENVGPWDTAAVWTRLTGEGPGGFEIILWLEKPQEEDAGLIKRGGKVAFEQINGKINKTS